jgi:hypothetical protein
MAKMAFFKLGSYLSYTPDANFDIGSGDYKIQFDILSAPNQYLLEVTVSPEGVDEYEGVNAVRDGIKHSVIIERVAGIKTVTVDSVVQSSASTGDGNDLSNAFFGEIGKFSAYLAALFGYAFYYTGYLSNVKIYSGDTLLLDMPLTEDLLDHSANEYVITNTGVELLEVGDTIDFVEGEQLSEANDSGQYLSGALVGGEAFVLDMTPIVGSNFNLRVSSAVVTAYGINKASCAYRFTLDEAITQGKIIRSAQIVLKDNGGISFESGVKARIRCEKAAAPAVFSDLTDYASRRLNLTTAYVSFDDVQQFESATVRAIDITSIVQEVVTNFSPTAIAVFIDDETLGTTEGQMYQFMAVFDEEFAPEIVIQYEDASAVSKKIMIKRN